jgi:hypothetical protein
MKKPSMSVSVPAILCLMAASVLAQDAFKVAPGAYKLQFENDWVKVVRVHYGPREKIPEHDHPAAATVFVYLNDSGPVRLYHVGEHPFENVRPPTRAGGFRLAQAAAERHQVENLSEIPSDFLRVELKTEPVDAKSFDGRFPPESTPVTGSFQKVTFENGQVRITRVANAAGQSCDLASPGPDTPSLLIALAPIHAAITRKDGSLIGVDMQHGQTQWLAPNEKARLENAGGVPAQILRIELRTKPAQKAGGKTV